MCFRASYFRSCDEDELASFGKKVVATLGTHEGRTWRQNGKLVNGIRFCCSNAGAPTKTFKVGTKHNISSARTECRAQTVLRQNGFEWKNDHDCERKNLEVCLNHFLTT